MRPKFSSWISAFMLISLMFAAKSALAESAGIIILAQIQGPTVNNIAPASGLNSQIINQVEISGTGFNATAWARLTRLGETGIEASTVTVADVDRLVCSFNLQGAQAGVWDVQVYDTYGGSGTLPAGFTIVADNDHDWVPDDWESTYGVDDPAADPDGDGLTNMEEYYSGTDPTVNNATLADADLDLIPDFWEAHYGINDPNDDPDLDGQSNLVEYFNGTDPLVSNLTLADVDGDGMPDFWERANGLDPNVDDAAGDPDHDTLTNDGSLGD